MSSTATGVILLLVGIGLIAGAIALVYFVIKAMASRDEPDITVTNSQTGQSARVGKGGLVIFLIMGIGVGVAGIACVVGGIKAFSG